MKLTKAKSNVYYLVFKYQQYQDTTAEEEGTFEEERRPCGPGSIHTCKTAVSGLYEQSLAGLVAHSHNLSTLEGLSWQMA
ncbi:hypothetical protein AAY473_016315 [Plecturocebus cupreus]